MCLQISVRANDRSWPIAATVIGRNAMRRANIANSSYRSPKLAKHQRQWMSTRI